MAENLAELVALCRSNRVDDLPQETRDILERTMARSSLAAHDAAVLSAFVSRVHPTRALEVGFATGSSAATLVTAARQSLRSYDVIDPFQITNFRSKGLNLIKEIKDETLVDFRFHEDSSHVALPRLLAEGRRYDYALIDASHKFDLTLIEVFYADQMLDVGGYMVLDDRPWPMVGGVVAFLEKNYLHYQIDTSHPRLTFMHKTGEDARSWFDYWHFDMPRSPSMEKKIDSYRAERDQAKT